MGKMKAVQVPKPGADFEVVEREIPEAGSDKSGFALKRVESVTAMWPRRKAFFPGYRIHVCPDTKWLALSTRSGLV